MRPQADALPTWPRAGPGAAGGAAPLRVLQVWTPCAAAGACLGEWAVRREGTGCAESSPQAASGSASSLSQPSTCYFYTQLSQCQSPGPSQLPEPSLRAGTMVCSSLSPPQEPGQDHNTCRLSDDRFKEERAPPFSLHLGTMEIDKAGVATCF